MKTIDAIKNRRSIKLRQDFEQPLPITKGTDFEKTMQEIIELAGRYAPFHYQTDERNKNGSLKGVEPWRFYALNAQNCRNLLQLFKKEELQKCSEGVLKMLAAADGLILAYWIPERQRDPKPGKFYPNIKNMEHIAATAAAVQSMLLAATSLGISSYWSSGGCIRKENVQEFLGIPTNQILIGTVFLFPDEYPESTLVIPGKNHEARTAPKNWMKWLEIEP